MKRLLVFLIVSLVLGLPVEAKECGEIVPEGGMRLVSATPGANEVKLSWVRPAGLVTHYMIYYGTAPGVYEFVSVPVEGPATDSYTVGGMGGGTKYYFAVRAANKCALGQWSGELSAVPTGAGHDGRPAVGFKREQNVRPQPTPVASVGAATPAPEPEEKKPVTNSHTLAYIVMAVAVVGGGGVWWWKRRGTIKR